EGPFADLGRPRDFLRASLEALDRGGPFPDAGGAFDAARRVLSLRPRDELEIARSVIGSGAIGERAVVRDSVVWNGVEISALARRRSAPPRLPRRRRTDPLRRAARGRAPLAG